MDPHENRPRKKIPTWAQRAELLDGEQHLIVQKPQPNICLITINRPDTKNLLTHRTRAQLFNQLQVNDQDPDVRVTVIRGAGGNFCAGHDFDSNRDEALPFFEPEIDGQTSRHVVNGWFMMNDLAKPVIAMVEGEAIGGGLELAAACDICICAEDAVLGYNAVRGQGLADYQVLPWMCGMRNAMELILTNKPMTGIEAAKRNFATECVPRGELEERTMNLAERVSKIPSDLLAFNKKSVHRAFEAMGMRTNIRNGVDLEALMFKAAGAKMLTARRGPQRGTPTEKRVPPPRPGVAVSGSSVATQAVSAKSAEKKEDEAPKVVAAAATSPAAPRKAPVATPVKEAAAAPKAAAPTTPAKSAAPATPAKAAAQAKAPTATKPAAPATPVRAPATPAKFAAATPAKAASTPAKAATPAAKAPATPAAKAPATPAAKATSTPSAAAGGDQGVHVHLHEAVHIHINSTPSKL